MGKLSKFIGGEFWKNIFVLERIKRGTIRRCAKRKFKNLHMFRKAGLDDVPTTRAASPEVFNTGRRSPEATLGQICLGHFHCRDLPFFDVWGISTALHTLDVDTTRTSWLNCGRIMVWGTVGEVRQAGHLEGHVIRLQKGLEVGLRGLFDPHSATSIWLST